MKTLCLNMIVKNESKIIKRVLESVKNYIDYWVICDTGSTDNTIELINEIFSDVKGELHQTEWKNFGHNRNEALRLAKNKADYILLIDADMELVVFDNNFKNELTHDMYKIKQGTNFTYYNVRIIRGDLDFEYMGSTHEYIECKKNDATTSELHSIKMNDYADGNNRPDKFKRDIELLTNDLQNDPKNGRAMFYIAQSYRDLKDYDNAIKWYKKRVDNGGWIEEIWYSLYMIGKCYLGLNMSEHGIYYFLEAYNKYPSRAESLYEIVKYYRINSKYNLSYIFYNLAKKISFPKNDTLFINEDIYNYKLDYEYSIIAYYLKQSDNGYIISDKFLHSTYCIPQILKDSVSSNIIFYVKSLNELIGNYTNTELFVNKTKNNHNICNPSIILYNDELILNVREVSYSFNIETNLYTYDKTIDTYNHLIKNIKIVNNKLISNSDVVLELNDDKLKIYEHYITGFEDLRLLTYNNEIYGTCTAIATNPDVTNEIILFKINDNKINNVLRLKGYENHKCQKNWMPFVNNNKINFLYSMDPFIILEPNMETGECKIVVNKKFDFDMKNYRGSSQLIDYDNGWLFIIHTVLFINSKRKYVHRFVHMDKSFNNIRISPLFYFIKKTIEFVAGLVEYDNKLFITYGYEDKLAYMAQINAESVKNILYPIVKL